MSSSWSPANDRSGVSPLSEEQRAIACTVDGHVYLRACPGAGKTRTIVAQFINTALARREAGDRRGIAVLSFSNRAVDEIRDRCYAIGKGELVEYPNFVGTFDSFIARYFVSCFPTSKGQRLRVVDSWSRLGIVVRRRGEKCQGFGLDALRWDPPAAFSLDRNRIEPAVWSTVESDLNGWLDAARRRRQVMMESCQVISADDARTFACVRIRNSKYQSRLRTILAARFHRIVVDEAQDCGDRELEVLSWLRNGGCSVVIVYDPDQSIYEFRGAVPEAVSRFIGSEPLNLTKNYRSTPTICRLAATLRHDRSVDVAAGRFTPEDSPIIVLPHTRKETPTVAAKFVSSLEGLVPRVGDVLVVAQSDVHARRLAGMEAGGAAATGGGLLGRAVRAIAQVRSGDPSDVKTGIRALEDFVLTALGLDELSVRLARPADCDPRMLRRLAMDVVAACPVLSETTVGQMAASVRRSLDLLAASEVGAGLRQAFGNPPLKRVICPRSTKTRSATSLLPTTTAQSGVRAMTIHAVKGGESEAVLLGLAPQLRGTTIRDTIAAWLSPEANETRRVLYVGATRAERVLGIAVPKAYLGQVVSILERGSVPHNVVS